MLNHSKEENALLKRGRQENSIKWKPGQGVLGKWSYPVFVVLKVYIYFLFCFIVFLSLLLVNNTEGNADRHFNQVDVNLD